MSATEDSNEDENIIEKIVRVKHITKPETGCTLFVFSKPLDACAIVCSTATATRDFHAAQMGASIKSIHGIVFNGGSAFGLDAAGGLLKYQRENSIGVPTKFGVVPICPAACIYDLCDKTKLVFVTADDVYEACFHLEEINLNVHGKVGTGKAAKTSKLFTSDYESCDGGIAFHKIKAADGIIIIAMAVVNAVGDVIDDKGNNLTGPMKNGKMYKTSELLQSGVVQANPKLQIENTTLVVVFTNLQLDREGLERICRGGMCGISRSIKPAFTACDGDVVITVTTNTFKSKKVLSEIIASDMAADCVSEAIRKAVSSVV